MAAEDFFNRWSKRTKPGESSVEKAEKPKIESAELGCTKDPKDEPPKPVTLPGIDDVAQLQDNSDFSVYMNPDVDISVRNLAMRKLFSNPHFNVMDGLDIYIDDYNKADPLPPKMLASLRHGESLINPLKHLEQASQQFLEKNKLANLNVNSASIAKADVADTGEVKIEEIPTTAEHARATFDTSNDQANDKDKLAKDLGTATDKDKNEY